MRRALDRLNALLSLALVAGAAWAWPRLPDRIPAHFGVDGQPDRWTDTSIVSWFLVPAIGVASYLCLMILRRWAVRNPDRMNLPAGRRVGDYPEAVRPAIVEHMRVFMALVALEMLVIFGLIEVGTYRTAVGGDGQSLMLAVLAICVLSAPVLLVVFLLGLQRVTRTAPLRPK